MTRDPRERETKREIPLASFAGLKSVRKRDADKERRRGIRERGCASERAKHASLTNAFQLSSSSSSSSSSRGAAAAPMRHKPSIEGKHEPQQQQHTMLHEQCRFGFRCKYVLSISYVNIRVYYTTGYMMSGKRAHTYLRGNKQNNKRIIITKINLIKPKCAAPTGGEYEYLFC